MGDVLVLTKADAENYRALCAAVAGREVRWTGQREQRDMMPWAKKLKLIHQQDYHCAECGKQFVVINGRCDDATIEHVIPFRFGSSANRHNIIIVCRKCNKDRAENFSIEMIERHYGEIDRSLLEYVPVLNLMSEQTRLVIRAKQNAKKSSDDN